MKFHLEATLEEIGQKRAEFVKALITQFQDVDTELADVLEKALPQKEQVLKYRCLRELHKQTKDQYQDMLQAMLRDIGEVLDSGVQKSNVIDLDERRFQKAVEALQKDEEEDPDYDSETGEPIFDPKTGLSPSEAAEEEEEGDEGEDLESSLKKALGGPYIGPRGGKWADSDHKIPWREAKAGIKKLQIWAQQHGGKLKPHKSDPSMVMVKVAKSKAKDLHAFKMALGAPEDIKVGSNYVMLGVSFQKATKVLHKQSSKKQKPVPKKYEAKFKVPPYAGVPWTKPETVAEGEAWCKGHGITASFPDLPTAQAVTKSLSESHPLVLDHVKFIGTSKQLNAWAKANPEIAKAAKTEAKHAMDLTKKSPLGGTAVAVAHPLTAKPYTASAIVVQDSYWSEHGVKKGKGNTGGFTVSGNLGGTVAHELGHVEGFVLRHCYPEDSQKSVWEIWKKHVVPQLKKKQVAKDISQYGQTNPHEAWAELSVLRRQGYGVPDWIQKALDEMRVDTSSWSKMMKS